MKKFMTTLILIAWTLVFLAGCTGRSSSELVEDLPVLPTETESALVTPTEKPVADSTATAPPESAVTPDRSPSEQDFIPNEVSDRDYSDLEIVTLLPQDAIPALTFPNYYGVEDANQEYLPDELVIGIDMNGDARAYSVGLLSRHEIVNDTIGGVPLAVTW